MIKPVVVVGSGFSGLSSAFHIAEAGLPVIILEKKDKIGGYFPRLKRQFPTNTCGVCFMHPHYPAYCPYIEAERHENINIFTNVSIENIINKDESVVVEYTSHGKAHNIEAQAVIIATGYEPFDISNKPELGGGLYSNVFPALIFEDYLYDNITENKSLPYKKIAYIQCVGSRDLKIKQPYCSSFCCMYALKQAMFIKEFNPEVEITIFYMDIRAFGKEYERYYMDAKRKGINFVRSAVASVKKRPSTGKLEILYTKDGDAREESFDAVVLSQGATIGRDIVELLKKLDIQIDFYESVPFKDREIRKNIYITGSIFDPMDIPDAVIDGISVAARIISKNIITPKLHNVLKVKKQKISKIGVFLFQCDDSVDEIVRAIFPETIKVKDEEELSFAISQNNIEGAVVISNDIRLTEAKVENKNYCGLHLDSLIFIPAYNNALQKEIEASILRLKQVKRSSYMPKNLNGKVCVIGGGLAGLVVSNFLAKIGFNVVIVEKDQILGGRLREIPSRTDLIKRYINDAENNPGIEIFLNTEVKSVSGRFGDFVLQLESKEETRKIKVDAIVITTGGKPRKNILSYEDGKRVFTNFDFEKRGDEILKSNKVVFIQCAGSRTEDNPVCYKVCCKKAVMNAIEIKNNNPEAEINILHKDIRTFGYSENLYRQARAQGVQFIRFAKEPEVVNNDDKLTVRVLEEGTGNEFILEPEYIILSSGIEPNNKDIARVFDIHTIDGFLIPYNKKTGILEIKNGLYSAGLCLAPNYSEDIIKQAEAVATRIALKLAGRQLSVRYNTAFVNPKYCCGCELCVKACPVSARYMDYDEKIAKVDEALCEGCGTCAMVCANKASQHKVFEHKSMLKTLDLMVG